MTPDERDLREEVDRLRLENQRLVTDRENAGDRLEVALRWVRRIWRAAWHRFYVVRWHLLHARDHRRGFKARDAHAPYALRTLRTPEAGRRRILHVIGNFHTGGSARLVVDLVEHLGHRFEQKVLVRSLPPAPAYTGIELIHRRRLQRPGQLSALLRRERPDLVHVHMLGHQHDEYGRHDWRWYHRVFLALERHGCPVIENLNIPVEPYVSNIVRCYVHVSDSVRTRFGRLDGWNVTIHPGSDFALFDRPADQPVPDDTIGMVYRLQPDKLNELSIEPFIQVVRKRPATKVHIVGGGQFLEPYKQRVLQAGVREAFTFTGYVPYVELPEHLARMSVFVAPVHTESFGQVSPFAMGMGLPVAGYRVGALEEITGTPDVLAPPGDAQRLTEIIIDLLDDRTRRLKIGQQNRQRAEAMFSIEAMVHRYEELYDAVLSAPYGRPAHALSQPSWFGLEPAHSAPIVTVLMAVFNGEKYLREAIDSVLTQTFGDFELLIVNDGSTDGSRAIVESYGDSRIRLIDNETNLGLARSLNRGLAVARGRYVARLDADDVSEPERLARQAEFMERHPDVVLLGSWHTLIDEHSKEIGRRWVPCDHFPIRWMLEFICPFAHSAVMIRRTALLTESYDESFEYAMDYDLWLRLAERGRVANLNQFLMRYRVSPDSMTARLGDKTERFDRVAASLAARLGWSSEDKRANERKADLLCAMISGATPDASVEEAEWGVRTLFELHADFCRRHELDRATARVYRAMLAWDTARALFWMAHRYPDGTDYGSAVRLFWAAVRLSPRSLLTREGLTLVLKLLGGQPAVLMARRFGRQRPT